MGGNDITDDERDRRGEEGRCALRSGEMGLRVGWGSEPSFWRHQSGGGVWLGAAQSVTH